jgi:hypothetical protein
MVREEFLVPSGGEADLIPLAAEDFQLSLGFSISAVRTPDGRWIFSPTTTQAERRQIVDDDAWWDRIDARAKRRAEKLEA